MTKRLWHVYIGCFFAPLLIYFCLSGAWQVFRLHDLPKNQPPGFHKILNELSKPHRDAVLPGQNARQTPPSVLFESAAALMALGFVMTAILGIQMGLQVPHRRKTVISCLAAGVIIPLFFLFLR